MRKPPLRLVTPHLPIDWSFSDEHGVNNGVWLGYRFYSDVPGWIVGAAWLQSAADSSWHGAFLFDTLGANALKGKMFLPNSVAGGEAGYQWVSRGFYPGWFIEPDTVYEWFVYIPYTSYAYIHSYLGFGLDSTPLHIIVDGSGASLSAGLYSYPPFFYGQNIFPANQTLYGVDMLFQPFGN